MTAPSSVATFGDVNKPKLSLRLTSQKPVTIIQFITLPATIAAWTSPSMAKLLHVPEDGVAVYSTEVFPINGKTFSLKEMQDLVAEGGTIEMLDLNEREVLVFDEEGKLKGLLYNKLATDFVIANANIDSYGTPGEWSKDLDQEKDYIVGLALLCSSSELE